MGAGAPLRSTPPHRALAVAELLVREGAEGR
eukprot:CAMPEP_0204188708 /NCGR_PEP_ID=MMETSP0361-20130328/57872_1 /ASSEMBLY_ACC=CAM_ASM_000343 /TAXON_ID=268821 /ORGANISM="Scrippsiella Hangoei, Strain SHTV-5" /LENGTH=30 /DNA_ID= /DNA_START= /DNA_END= /DNA_ORIENTATION=